MRTFATVTVLLLLGCAAAGDGRAPAAGGDPAAAQVETADDINKGGRPEGTQLERGDMNGDGRPDVWKYTREVPDPAAPGTRKTVLARKEADLNFDGSKDVYIEYGDGEIPSHEAFDFDFDGRVDQENFYEQSRIREKRVFASGTNRVFIWKYFEEGALSRTRQDDNGDGIADRCEDWFKGQRLIRRGRDTNRDGECDDWQTVR
ncbi:MAG: hypothetical protein FJ098_09010 [Deltaproteobacteria bacterium]|nr:hypothetical protein [Deltaproteobacteria bacterium]